MKLLLLLALLGTGFYFWQDVSPYAHSVIQFLDEKSQSSKETIDKAKDIFKDVSEKESE